MISIDHSSPKKNQHTYNQLRINTKRANSYADIEFSDLDSWKPLGGGTHRKYCHQGFFPEDSYKERREVWEYRRDNILIPSIAIAFNIEKDSPATVIISLIGYYIHMLGDLYEGERRYMGNINSYSKLLSSFSKELKCLSERVPVPHSKMDSMIETIHKASHHQTTIKYSDSCNTGIMYQYSKAYLRKTVPCVIKELIGIRPRDINLIK